MEFVYRVDASVELVSAPANRLLPLFPRDTSKTLAGAVRVTFTKTGEKSHRDLELCNRTDVHLVISSVTIYNRYVCMFPFRKSVTDKVICSYKYAFEFLEGGIKTVKE